MNVFAQFMCPAVGSDDNQTAVAASQPSSFGSSSMNSNHTVAEAASTFLELEAACGGLRRGVTHDEWNDDNDVPDSEDEAFISRSPVKRSSHKYYFAVDATRLNEEAAAILDAAEKTKVSAAAAIVAAKIAKPENNPFAEAARGRKRRKIDADFARDSKGAPSPMHKRSTTATSFSSYFTKPEILSATVASQ